MSQALWAKWSPSNNRRNVPCRRLLSLTLSIRTASVVVSLGPLPALLTIISATLLGRQLKEVNDLSNMGRDVRLVGGVMLASFRKQQQSRSREMCGTLSSGSKGKRATEGGSRLLPSLP